MAGEGVALHRQGVQAAKKQVTGTKGASVGVRLSYLPKQFVLWFDQLQNQLHVCIALSVPAQVDPGPGEKGLSSGLAEKLQNIILGRECTKDQRGNSLFS